MAKRPGIDRTEKGAEGRTNGRNGQSAAHAATPKERYRSGQTLTRQEMRKRLGLTDEEIEAANVPQ